MSEIYKSQTHGPIPLSFEGRRLLQNLRYAIVHAISAQAYSNNDNAVAKARGDLAKYMSNLEQRKPYAGQTITKRFDIDLETRSPAPMTVTEQYLRGKSAPTEVQQLRDRCQALESLYGGLQKRLIALKGVAAQCGSRNRDILQALEGRVYALERKLAGKKHGTVRPITRKMKRS